MLKKKTKKIGEILVDRKVITPEQLRQALEEQKITKKEIARATPEG